MYCYLSTCPTGRISRRKTVSVWLLNMMTHIVFSRLNISRDLTWKGHWSIGPIGSILVPVVLRRCKYARTAPTHPIVMILSMSTELEMCSSRPSWRVNPMSSGFTSSGPQIPLWGTKKRTRCSWADDTSSATSLLSAFEVLNSWVGRTSIWYVR